jgi:hypothetical protein
MEGYCLYILLLVGILCFYQLLYLPQITVIVSFIKSYRKLLSKIFFLLLVISNGDNQFQNIPQILPYNPAAMEAMLNHLLMSKLVNLWGEL